MSPFYDDFRDEGKKIVSSIIINDMIISNHGGGVGDALLFHSNNHMDPNDSENPVQSLPHYQNVSVFNDDWENIVGKVLFVVLDFEVCCPCTLKYVCSGLL